MIEPLVSIIIPSYNRATLIGETLDSVLNQTYTNWECIVVDDGSTDHTIEIVRAFAKSDKRFKILERPKNRVKGANACRNFGYENSKGDYINWLDSDDLFSPNKLKEQIKILTINSTIGEISTCGWNKFRNTTNGISARDIHLSKDYVSGRELLKDFNRNVAFFPCHCYLSDRSIFKKSGLWDESLEVNQDGEFFTRVLLSSNSVLFAKRAIAYYRIPESSNVSQIGTSKKAIAAIESWKLIERHLEKVTPKYSYDYVANAKEYLFSRIVNRPIVKDYPSFFKKQLSTTYKLKSYWQRLFKKIKTIWKSHNGYG
ncbi:glycosyltransferase family 2 protein [Dokdonia sp. Hel_I_53]|uniref:glycosyltransferase family 2 protein n=1 Tax=Dokdonia sp. Hel_I_53 TaxID=1566287 RepID=UPI00119C24BC|nr:glycosyltransferase family 2 protein [Dokdonia sp. Hel_I_53]TVZ53387.1 glycosyl transferase family 2 [Dokdonia sp. Hel_I_53]